MFASRLLPAILAFVLVPFAAAADRALLVGIDAYDSDPNIPPLQGAVNDVAMMESFLTSHLGYQAEDILILTDARATRRAVLDAFETWLIAGTAPGDRLFLFFAGHGYQVPSLTPGETFDQILITHDTFLDDAGEVQNFLRDKELNALLQRLEDRQVTVLVDACHSGGITRAVLPADMPVTRFPLPLLRAQQAAGKVTAPVRSIAGAGRGLRRSSAIVEAIDTRTVWSAVSSHQLAFEDTRLPEPGGFFTARFVAGLADGKADLNGDGKVTHAELHSWLTRESQLYCEELGAACVFGLTPTLETPLSQQILPVLDPRWTDQSQEPEAAEYAASVTVAPEIYHPPSLTEVVEAVLVVPAKAQIPPGEVQLDILADGPLLKGAEVQFRIETSFDGYLTVFDLNPAGHLVQIFPNRFSAAQGRESLIRKGFPITIPDPTYGFAFTVAEPLGAGQLVALVTEEPIDLSDIAPASRGLVIEPVPDQSADADILLRLGARLRDAWTGDEYDRAPRHALAVQDYVTGY
ncbi:caspase family protein [Natronohydrobacter thiooxidans]|uniref:caspase family protein n=1 Tax=Natronohydrobacter thiooxidans TaxID=87172 RepID=UPI0008FF1558|nr:caspase family protein [Natronohydrobacter thiooxidans]